MLSCDKIDPSQRRKIIVFGGEGFLGSHLVELLAELGHKVTVFSHSPPGSNKNLQHFEGRYHRFSGDFADADAVAAALKGQEIAFNFILSSTPVSSWEEPLRTIETDLLQSVRFFELCAKGGVRKIVFASSGGALYGPQTEPADEGTVPRPFNPHGIAKLCAEHFLRYYREKYGIAADSYRIGNAYGPRQPINRTQGVIGAWIGRIIAGQTLDVYGDETTKRDYVNAKDVAQLMTHSLRDLDASGTYNLGTGCGTSILELLEIFKTVVKSPFGYQLHPRRPSDNTNAILPSGKLLKHFPGFAFRDLEQGIRETYQWAMDDAKGDAKCGEIGQRSGACRARRCAERVL